MNFSVYFKSLVNLSALAPCWRSHCYLEMKNSNKSFFVLWFCQVWAQFVINLCTILLFSWSFFTLRWKGTKLSWIVAHQCTISCAYEIFMPYQRMFFRVTGLYNLENLYMHYKLSKSIHASQQIVHINPSAVLI